MPLEGEFCLVLGDDLALRAEDAVDHGYVFLGDSFGVELLVALVLVDDSLLVLNLGPLDFPAPLEHHGAARLALRRHRLSRALQFGQDQLNRSRRTSKF